MKMNEAVYKKENESKFKTYKEEKRKGKEGGEQKEGTENKKTKNVPGSGEKDKKMRKR